MSPRRVAALVLVSVLALGGPVRAEDPTYADTFLRAERAERALGDLDEAVRLYVEAVALAGDDVARRGSAEVRAGACLRRLGREDDARRRLTPWSQPVDGVPEMVRVMAVAELERLDASGGGVARGDGGADGRGGQVAPSTAEQAEFEARISTLENENARLIAQLEAAVANTEREGRIEVARLIEDLRAKDVQLAELRQRLDALSPADARAVLEVRREEKRSRSRVFTRAARVAHREGRFADAAELLNDALLHDPENADARALLARISAPRGAREQLYQAILDTVALAHQVRRSRLAAEVRSLLDEAARRLDVEPDTPDAATAAQDVVAPLERALALIDVAEDAFPDPAAVRAEAGALLRRATARGARRAPERSPLAGGVDPAWVEALRHLLEYAGDEVDGSLTLRLHDLGRALANAASGLPPVGPRPTGWTLSAERVTASDLLTAYLADEFGASLRAGSASIEVVGSTAVAVTDLRTQRRIDDRLSGMKVDPGPALRLLVSARRGVPGAWQASLQRVGAVVRELPGGARTALLAPSVLAAFERDLAAGGHPEVASTELTAAPFRAFRLTTGTAAAAVSVRVLPIGGGRPGAALSVDVTWTPDGRRDGVRLGQHAVAAGALEPAAALVIFGLADPADPTRDLAVLVRREGAPPPPPLSATDAVPPRPSTDAPSAAAGEYLFPESVRAIDELGAAPMTLPEHPLPSRADALRRRLEPLVSSSTVLDVKDDRVVVVAPEAVHAAVRALLARCEAKPLTAFDVDLFELDETSERRLLETVKTFSPSDGLLFATLKDEAQTRNVAALLAATGALLPLPEQRVTVPSLVRRDLGGVSRFTHLRELDVREDGVRPAVSRFESSFVEEGFVLALRPFGRTASGLVDLDLSVRATFVRDRGVGVRETPLGPAYTARPETADLWGDVTVALREDGAVVLAGMVNPFRSARGRTRLVVLVRPVR